MLRVHTAGLLTVLLMCGALWRSPSGAQPPQHNVAIVYWPARVTVTNIGIPGSGISGASWSTGLWWIEYRASWATRFGFRARDRAIRRSRRLVSSVSLKPLDRAVKSFQQ